MSNQEIPVFYIAPNDMFAPAVVSIVSILENTKSFIQFHIIDRKTLPVSKANKEKLNQLKTKYKNFSVKYISIDPDNFDDLVPPVSKYITNDTYFRYLIPELAPEIKKTIYLDVDTIVKGDISELYNEDLGDNYIGGINHPKEYWDNFPLFYKIVSNLKLDNPYFYINGGVIVFNCEKCRKDRVGELLIQKTKELKEKIMWADQDIMNLVLQGKIKELPWQYNTLLDALKKYKYPILQTKIVHYNGPKKPWNKEVYLGDLFWKYAEQTPFYNDLKQIYKKAQEKNTKTYYLFDCIPLLAVKVDDHRKFWKLFGCIPFLKTTER